MTNAQHLEQGASHSYLLVRPHEGLKTTKRRNFLFTPIPCLYTGIPCLIAAIHYLISPQFTFHDQSVTPTAHPCLALQVRTLDENSPARLTSGLSCGYSLHGLRPRKANCSLVRECISARMKNQVHPFPFVNEYSAYQHMRLPATDASRP